LRNELKFTTFSVFFWFGSRLQKQSATTMSQLEGTRNEIVEDFFKLLATNGMSAGALAKHLFNLIGSQCNFPPHTEVGAAADWLQQLFEETINGFLTLVTTTNDARDAAAAGDASAAAGPASAAGAAAPNAEQQYLQLLQTAFEHALKIHQPSTRQHP
jgi:hypothetical protein